MKQSGVKTQMACRSLILAGPLLQAGGLLGVRDSCMDSRIVLQAHDAVWRMQSGGQSATSSSPDHHLTCACSVLHDLAAGIAIF